MFTSASGFDNQVAAPNFPTALFSNFTPNKVPMNSTFFGQPAQPVGWTVSTGSTQHWPSADEQYSNSSSGSLEVPERPPAALTLPIQNLQDMIDLEHSISSMQQYECLLCHLQVLTIRHHGNESEMFRHFIADSVLSRVGFSRLKSGKYDCTMRDNFPRIMSAIKSAWFPARDRNSFEAQLLLLLKNSHTRHKSNTHRNHLGDIQNQPGMIPDAPAQQQQQQPKVHTQPNGHELMNQWYQYAIYYRDRYQITKKENQKLKANCEVSRRRVSRCLRKMNRLRQHMDVLEQRIDEIDG
ncbi:uncharacterized protein LOC6035049 isoform X3 [Culex quinquefasciatus]|nr:uncharacterized protein LOC6035049 isoform X3 [Culex quinquefasciatus]